MLDCNLKEQEMKTEYNTKLDKNIEDFISKRIEGKSFDEIASELKISKQTLIDWNKKEFVMFAIDEGKVFKINALVKAFKFDLSNRIKTYLELSNKIHLELQKRDLSEVNTDTLLKMSIANDNRLRNMLNKDIQIGQNSEVRTIGMYGDGFFKLPFDE